MSSTEMKSYLSLIPISAKVRRRQNRMTILCIVLEVFLVTVVFSMADMAIRMETSNQLNKNGNWHIMVKDLSLIHISPSYSARPRAGLFYLPLAPPHSTPNSYFLTPTS